MKKGLKIFLIALVLLVVALVLRNKTNTVPKDWVKQYLEFDGSAYSFFTPPELEYYVTNEGLQTFEHSYEFVYTHRYCDQSGDPASLKKYVDLGFSVEKYNISEFKDQPLSSIIANQSDYKNEEKYNEYAVYRKNGNTIVRSFLGFEGCAQYDYAVLLDDKKAFIRFKSTRYDGGDIEDLVKNNSDWLVWQEAFTHLPFLKNELETMYLILSTFKEE